MLRLSFSGQSFLNDLRKVFQICIILSNLNIEPGDLITVCTCGNYNRYHRDHIAIVVDVTSTTITTIEGNTSGNNGSSCVATKTYNRSNGTRSGCVISYLLKPNY